MPIWRGAGQDGPGRAFAPYRAAAVVADCYVSPRDTVCDPAKVYAEDPGAGATLAVLVIDAGPEGLAMCLLPYRWDDDGTPMWDDDGRCGKPFGDLPTWPGSLPTRGVRHLDDRPSCLAWWRVGACRGSVIGGDGAGGLR